MGVSPDNKLLSDVLSPETEVNFTKKAFFRIQIFLTSYEPELQASRKNDGNSFTILKFIALIKLHCAASGRI